MVSIFLCRAARAEGAIRASVVLSIVVWSKFLVVDSKIKNPRLRQYGSTKQARRDCEPCVSGPTTMKNGFLFFPFFLLFCGVL